MLAAQGVDLRYWLRARWPDDVAIVQAIARRGEKMAADQRDALAIDIANRVREMIDG